MKKQTLSREQTDHVDDGKNCPRLPNPSLALHHFPGIDSLRIIRGALAERFGLLVLLYRSKEQWLFASHLTCEDSPDSYLAIVAYLCIRPTHCISTQLYILCHPLPRLSKSCQVTIRGLVPFQVQPMRSAPALSASTRRGRCNLWGR